MLRPESFSHPHIAFRNTPYLRETIALLSPAAHRPSSPSPSQQSSTGSRSLLTRGQIIWTRSPFALGDMPARTVAFVEEIGLISLDPRWLVPADLAPAPVQDRPAPSPSHCPPGVLRSVS